MHGAWGKPYGTVAQVNIGQIIMSIHYKDSNSPVIQEALRRTRYNFPGHQKIIIFKRQSFMSIGSEECLSWGFAMSV